MERVERGGNATSDAGMEKDEGEHTPLTASPWGTQESGARRLRGDAGVGGIDGRKVTSAMADGGMQGCHGAQK